MKHTWAVVLVSCLVVSAAFASGSVSVTTARSLGMGEAVIGVADDAAAWYQNPAGLASLNAPVLEGKQWGNDIMATWGQVDMGDTYDGWALDWSGWQPAKNMGVGAGYTDEDGGKVFGAGFGMGIKDMPLSVGVNVVRNDPDMGDGTTLFNLGALYKFAQPEKAPIKVGLTIEDITDETDNGPFFNVGVLWPATPKLGIAVDITDITDQSDNGPYLNAGAEYVFGTNSEWTARVGCVDDGDSNDLTVGVGYKAPKFRVDVAYADIADGMWAVSAATGF